MACPHAFMYALIAGVPEKVINWMWDRAYPLWKNQVPREEIVKILREEMKEEPWNQLKTA